MEKQIIISSDSTCDLSSELIARYNIRILPMGVTLGDNSYRDGVDITPDDIYAYHAKTGQLEADWMTANMRAMHEAGASYSSMAVLYRKNSAE